MKFFIENINVYLSRYNVNLATIKNMTLYQLESWFEAGLFSSAKTLTMQFGDC